MSYNVSRFLGNLPIYRKFFLSSLILVSQMSEFSVFEIPTRVQSFSNCRSKLQDSARSGPKHFSSSVYTGHSLSLHLRLKDRQKSQTWEFSSTLTVYSQIIEWSGLSGVGLMIYVLVRLCF